MDGSIDASQFKSARRPLVLVVSLYAAGLLLGEWRQPPLPVLFSAALAIAAAALLVPRLRPYLLWPLVVLTGWTSLVASTAIVSPHDLRTISSGSPEQVVVRGTLTETPTERIHLQDEQEFFRTLAYVSVTAVNHGSNWKPAHGKVAVTTPGTLPVNFFAGQQVEVAGILAHPAPPRVHGMFDYRAYLRRHGIHFELRAHTPADWLLLTSDRNPPLSDRFVGWARKTMSLGLPEHDRALRLLFGMALGERSALARETYEPFVRSGTMHIFAISGLHVALITGILVSLLRVVQVSRLWCGVIVIPLIWFYTAATGWQSSAVRATIMMSIVVGGWSLQRPGDLLNSLAGAALIILIWEPQQLFRASFQLSFFVVLSIALAMPPLTRLCDRLLAPDPLLPHQLIPRWKRWLGVPLRWLALMAATSLAAWLGSWPLTASYFHLLSPVTLLANIVIIPLGSAAMASSLGSLLCGAWWPGASELFNHAAWLWMTCMMKLSKTAAELPGAFFHIPSPSPVDLVIYYTALVGLLSGRAVAPKMRVWTIVALICIAGFYGWRWSEARQSHTLTILPLNGGHAVFCDSPGTTGDVLVDCGNESSVQRIVKPFLQARGLRHLPCLFLTHGDLRHVGGYDALQAAVPISEVVTSPVSFRSAAYRRIIASLEHDRDRWRKVEAGSEFRGWDILHPAGTNRFPQADDSALVLRKRFQTTRVLLLSDLGRPGQNALLERTADLRADIVVAGLPFRGEPLCDALIEAIQPRLIVIADSEFPATERARADLRERLERHGAAVLYTREAGDVTIRLNPKGWRVRASNGRNLDSSFVKTAENEKISVQDEGE